jgi:hypothetical protein
MTKGEMSKKKVAKIALRVVTKFIEKQRPAAILLTFDCNAEPEKEPSLDSALVAYLEEELDGVMIAKSSYAIPNNVPLSRVLANIERITSGALIVYAFPFRSWEGSGNTKANDWLDEYVPRIW